MIIELSNGRGKAFIDDEDYDKVKGHKWCLHTKGYAITWDGILMHDLIMGAKGVDHKDGDKLDNRKSNLRVLSNAKNVRNNWKRRAGRVHRPYHRGKSE